jgi:hypothetical protein
MELFFSLASHEAGKSPSFGGVLAMLPGRRDRPLVATRSTP